MKNMIEQWVSRIGETMNKQAYERISHPVRKGKRWKRKEDQQEDRQKKEILTSSEVGPALTSGPKTFQSGELSTQESFEIPFILILGVENSTLRVYHTFAHTAPLT